MAKDKREPVEPHRLLQDKPEGSREMIERELRRQQSAETPDGDEKEGAQRPPQQR